MLTPTEYENTYYNNRTVHTPDPSELTPRNRGTISLYKSRGDSRGANDGEMEQAGQFVGLITPKVVG